MGKTRILILGVTGMLGHTLFKEMYKAESFEVFGTVRSKSGLQNYFNADELSLITEGVDADNFESILKSVADIQPEIIINCIGIIKQLPSAKDPLTAININAALPHRLALVAKTAGARFIHISTDCVFDGRKGNYTEEDNSDAEDLYGKTKYLGEVKYPHSITLRTSIIGHELKSNLSLVDWFMCEKGEVNGFTNAIYSGFPTIEMANIISKYIIPNKDLNGLYHVSSNPVSKYDLLNIIKDEYGKDIVVKPYDNFVLDRSMSSDRFRKLTGYIPPTWEKMIREMFEHFSASDCYIKKRS